MNRTRKYKGHTITSCGLSWYIDRTPGMVDGIFAPTLAAAKARINAMKPNKIAYSPYYQGLMIWRPGEGCSSFYEKEFEREPDARLQLRIEAERLDAEIVPAGSLDGWPD